MGVAGRVLSTRWMVRAPIPLYRHGFGWVFGRRLLLLEHVGRTSGLPRYVVLEVVDREAPDTYVIASGFGRTSQWFQNLLATPQCHVSVGRLRRQPAVARVVDDAERDRMLAEYAARHPRGWARLRDAIVEVTGDPEPDIPLVRLVLSR